MDLQTSFGYGPSHFVRRSEHSGGGSRIRIKSRVLLCIVKQSMSHFTLPFTWVWLTNVIFLILKNTSCRPRGSSSIVHITRGCPARTCDGSSHFIRTLYKQFLLLIVAWDKRVCISKSPLNAVRKALSGG